MMVAHNHNKWGLAAAGAGVLLFHLILLVSVDQGTGQFSRVILGDIKESKISDVADPDEREYNVYRRPATYLIIASKIVRPSTVYQVTYFTFSLHYEYT